MTKTITAASTLLAAIALTGCSTSETRDADDADGIAAVEMREAVPAASLVGTWDVDLRPTPEAEAYFQPFVIESIDGSSFTGTFYGTAISEGRINDDWGEPRLSFVTADGTGPYLHAAWLEDGVLHGMSNSTGRGFLSVWSATRGGGQ